jgi:tetratricopeptide (TPR) repeat protein
VWNPDRIDQIEIIEGPASLVGIGRELWHCEPDDKAREVTLTQAMVEAAAQSARTTAIADERANALASKIAEFHADDAFFAEQQKARLLVVAAMAQPIRVTGATCIDADIYVNGLWVPTSERAHGRVVYRKEDALDGWSSDPRWLEYDGEYNRWVFHEDSKRGTSAGSACSSAADNEPGLSDIPGESLSDSPLAVKHGEWRHVDSQGKWARSYDMKVEGVEMEVVRLAREAQTERFAEAASRARPVVVSGTTGSFGHIIDGVYLPTPERSASRVVFKKTFKNDKDLCANLRLSFHDRLRRWCIVPCDDDTALGAGTIVMLWSNDCATSVVDSALLDESLRFKAAGQPRAALQRFEEATDSVDVELQPTLQRHLKDIEILVAKSPPGAGVLQVSQIACNGVLPAKGGSSGQPHRSDPYVKFTLKTGQNVQQTNHEVNTLSPVFKDQVLDIEVGDEDTITWRLLIEVFDNGPRHDFLGSLEIELSAEFKSNWAAPSGINIHYYLTDPNKQVSSHVSTDFIAQQQRAGTKYPYGDIKFHLRYQADSYVSRTSPGTRSSHASPGRSQSSGRSVHSSASRLFLLFREEPQLDLLPHEASGWTAPVQEAFNAVQHGQRDGFRSEKLSVRAVEWSEAEAAAKEYECELEIDGRVDALRLYRELAGQGDEGRTRSSSSEQLQIDRAECLSSATSFPLDPRCWSQFARQDIDHQPPWGVLVVGSVQEDDDVSIAEERRRTTSDATLNLTRLLVDMGDAAAARQLFLHTIDGLTTEVGAFHLSTINAKWDFTRFLAELAVKSWQSDSNQVPKLSHRAQEELELLPSAKENEQEWSALSYKLSLLCDEPQKFRGCKKHSWTDDLDDCTLACKLFAQSIRELGVYILLGGSALMSKHEELNKFGFGSRGYTAEVLRSKATLGDFLWDIGANDHARHVTEQCIADQVELFGSAHARDTLEARAGLAGRLRTAYIATWLSPWARDAVRVYDELLADIQASTDSGKQSWVLYLRLALAELLTKMGKRADAKRLLEEVIQSDNTRDHMYAVVAKRLLCTVLLHMRDVPAARRLVEEMIEASSTFHGTLHVVTLSHKLHLGRVMHASEDREQAIRLYQQLIKDCQYAVGPAHDLTKECTKRLRRVLREEALRARLPAAAAAAQEQASILGEGGQALCVSGFPTLRARSAALDQTIGLDSFNGRYVHTANDYTPEGFPVWRLCNTATMSASEGEGSATHDAESGPDEQRVLYFSPQRADWVLSTEISLSSFAAWASPNFERWAIAKPPPEMGDDDDTVAADNTTVESGVEAIGPVPLGRDQGWVVLDAGLAMPTLGNGKVDTLGRDPTRTFSNTKVIEVALTVEPGG